MTTRSTLRAGDAAVEVLAQAGVRRFYTVPGESFLEVLDAVEQHPELSLVSTRHESGASFMAEADAKLSGVPAVAMATRGVGAAKFNFLLGLHVLVMLLLAVIAVDLLFGLGLKERFL